MMKRKQKYLFLALAAAVVCMALLCLFAGSSGMSVSECLAALAGRGTDAQVRIMRNIRIPRVLAALIAGAGLSLAGLTMQTTLNNIMASPSTLGVSNAAVFGANLSIIAFAGGFVETGHNLSAYGTGVNPFATGLLAFVFAMLTVGVILAMCGARAFAPGVVVLAGIAIGSIWTAATTVLQFYATDVGLSAAVIWSFGDLGRATYRTDAIMLLAVLISAVYFSMRAWKYNALLSGDLTAASLGIAVNRLRVETLFFASLITAVCVSFLGMIGFVGIICPHIAKRLFGQEHRMVIPASAMTGSLLLLCADTLSRSMGNGSALPVGAITSLLGAPFFLALILHNRRDGRA